MIRDVVKKLHSVNREHNGLIVGVCSVLGLAQLVAVLTPALILTIIDPRPELPLSEIISAAIILLIAGGLFGTALVAAVGERLLPAVPKYTLVPDPLESGFTRCHCGNLFPSNRDRFCSEICRRQLIKTNYYV